MQPDCTLHTKLTQIDIIVIESSVHYSAFCFQVMYNIKKKNMRVYPKVSGRSW